MKMLLMLAAIFIGSGSPTWKWERLPSLPDKEGFAGPFAGTSRGVLLVAGGANFPEKKPREGGKKVWSDTVFALSRPGGEWRVAGKLPRPLGYGVSVTHRDGVVCVGGSDSERHHADAFRLEWDGERSSPRHSLRYRGRSRTRAGRWSATRSISPVARSRRRPR
jgi:N-acetylneuraminate epimerase